MQRLFAFIALGIVVTLGAATAGCARRAVAQVNGEAITEREFQDRLETYAGQQTLDRLILEKLVAQAAKRKGIEVSDAEVSEIVDRLRKPFAERWGEYLSTRGQTEEDFRHDIHDRLLVTKVAIPEKEIKEYWEQNRAHFDVPATARYRRIILKSKADAEKAHQAILGGKLNFDQALKTMSVPDDLLAKQGGEIGPVPLGYGDPSLEKTLSTLPPQQLSEPIP
jgi:parvulin-like peptidyl-prolyl isomerase